MENGQDRKGMKNKGDERKRNTMRIGQDRKMKRKAVKRKSIEIGQDIGKEKKRI